MKLTVGKVERPPVVIELTAPEAAALANIAWGLAWNGTPEGDLGVHLYEQLCKADHIATKNRKSAALEFPL